MRTDLVQILNTVMDRRAAIAVGGAAIAGAATAAAAGLDALNPFASTESREASRIEWQQFFQANYRVMTEEEKQESLARLERLHELRNGTRNGLGVVWGPDGSVIAAGRWANGELVEPARPANAGE